jgi:uncharacterized protein
VSALPRGVAFLTWLRKTHGWLGLWGAALGLLFGVSGVLLNHRSVMKIPAAKSHEVVQQLPVPERLPADPQAWGEWLRAELRLERPPTRVRVEPGRPVEWGDRTLQQPAHWIANFAGPGESVQADWWAGNSHVTVKRTDYNGWSMLTNLHKGTGLGVGWILLVDTLAGSIVLLSLTGVVLWTKLNRRRLVGAGIVGTSLVWLLAAAVPAF